MKFFDKLYFKLRGTSAEDAIWDEGFKVGRSITEAKLMARLKEYEPYEFGNQYYVLGYKQAMSVLRGDKQ